MNVAQDPFSFDAAEAKPAAIQPKKFFKSRNAAPSAVPEDSRADAAIYRQVPDSQYGQPRPPKAAPAPKTSASKKEAKAAANNAREEPKPPIVLRICKGTARLVSTDLDYVEPETYRISSPISSLTKLSLSRTKEKSSDAKLEPKSLRSLPPPSPPPPQQQLPEVTTVSISLEDSETRRTTRSRAKHLHLDVASAPPAAPPTPVPQSPQGGLSLTLRKSTTDSNNTLISHYDIVKTEGESKPEPIVPIDQPVPTSTQELLDILNSDPEPALEEEEEEAPEEVEQEEPMEVAEESEPPREAVETEAEVQEPVQQHCKR